LNDEIIMGKRVTLHLSNAVIYRAHKLARSTGRDIEDVLAEWLSDCADDMPVEMLSNDEIIALCECPPNIMSELELRHLLRDYRERELTPDEAQRLDELVYRYRRELVRKSQALQVATARGLRVESG
jgi:hypothetical protein